jgi:hypothetical protein
MGEGLSYILFNLTHGIFTPYPWYMYIDPHPWYFDTLPMVICTPYPWYFDELIPDCRFLLKMTKFHHIIFYLKKNIDGVYIFY